MKAIRLQNVRSLKDTGYIELKPITLLLGQNSSGKSTVLRSLPLLKQSVRTRSNAPILWYGDLVDFGSIREVRSAFSPEEPVIIELDLGRVNLNRAISPYSSPLEVEAPEASISLELYDVEGKTRLKRFSLRISTDVLICEIDRAGSVANLDVNGFDLTTLLPNEQFRVLQSEFVPQLIATGRSTVSRGLLGSRRRGADITEREISKFYSERLSNRVSVATINSIVRKTSYRPYSQFPDRLRDAAGGLKSAHNLVTKIIEDPDQSELTRLRSLALVGALGEILIEIQRVTTRHIGNVSYVGPSRATGERYYRLQELAVDQIDPQGRNLAMFLHSLNTAQQKHFSQWLVEAVGYSIQIERSAGHVQILLKEEESNQYFNIADMGYGFSQMLPIMAQVWARRTRPINLRREPVLVAMEQPELHLHPAYQARLANVFARSIARDTSGDSNQMQFLIETHSEALINQLGTLIYEDRLSASDVAIYVFEKSPDDGITDIKSVHFDDDGTLSNWPIGFFSATS